MSLYGSQLWDFQSKVMETFYVAWRKSVRRILGVPPTNLCFRLALLGSRSNVSNNISLVCKSFCMTKSNSATCTPVYRNVNDMLVDEETKSITNVIKELLYTKHCLRVSTDQFVLNMSEIDQITTQLCME